MILALRAPSTGPATFGLEAIAATSATAAVSIIGLPATVAAIAMAVAVGDKRVLNSLRDNYVISNQNGNRLTLRHK